MPKAQKITTFLWYATQAEEAAKFYTSIFPRSKVNSVSALQSESHSGPAGSVKVVDFTLMGQRFQAMTAGPHHEFNDAISIMVECETQKEIDKYWNALLKDGGKEQACGWLNDRFGLRWQIIPSLLMKAMREKNKARAKRVSDAMLKMIKIDLAEIKRAYKG